ncbi:MAG: GNAT family N-acetyltransferase [Chloroflexota bacterium]|nr:MAG: GNAT family N-acetyltransferase [Chloroflexota bacterium]
MLTSSDIRIHRATATEAEAIARVHVRAWRAAYRGILPQPYLDGLDVASRAGSWGREMSTLPEERRPWVAIVDGRILGFCVAGPARDEDLGARCAEVYAIYVDPECWAIGVGRALLDHQLAFLRRRGHAEACLWVLAANTRAIGFYEHGRWAADGRRRSITIGGQEVEEVRYRVRLRAAGGRPGEAASARLASR